jgi:hypothetical protein
MEDHKNYFQKNHEKMKSDNLFKTGRQFIMPVILLFFVQSSMAQTVPTTQLLPDTAKMTYNQISGSMKLYVFPSKGQSNQQQKKDEFECYQWAVEQSGIDPLNLPKIEVPAPATGPTGGAVVGAAKGAAAGVAIGAIAGDAGKGAAIGAAAGAMAGRRAGKQAQAQQNQQAQASAAKSEQAMKDDFKKAFSVCMEVKGYTIK